MAEANPIVTGENVLMSLDLWQVNGMPEGARNLYTWLEEDPETSTMSVTDEVADNVFQDTTMPIACSSGTNRASQVHVEIIEEPEDGIKFRYEKEERLSGRIKGANSTANHKTYPTIKVHGYRGPARVVVSLIAVSPPYYPHPHRLEGESCGSGVCYKTIDNPEMICSHKLTPHLLQEIVEYPLHLGYLHRSDPPTVGQCSSSSVLISFGGGGAGEAFF